MGFKCGILFFTLLAGSFAVPAVVPDDGPNEDYFYHTNPAARIVGGSEAAEGSAPHMVALTNGLLIRSFLCGGSLITTRTVLTAAHCIAAVYSWGALSGSLLGTVGTNRWNTGGIAYSFAGNITHEEYDRFFIKNDIGLLFTHNPVVLSETVNVVPLGIEHIPGGVEARATGWGRIRHQGALSATLLELTVTTIEGEDCVRALSPNRVDPNIELCTTHSPDHGMCNGDSGSALVDPATGKEIGIVSWGIPCARGMPDMFVRVSAYKEWLEENVV